MESPYWSGMAERYRALTPPLRVSDSERDIYRKLAAQWRNDLQAPRVLVLGATPDFYDLQWPEHSDLLAVDRSQPMLRSVWPGDESESLCAEWTSADLPDHSRDIVLCDGGLTFFSYPQPLQQLLDNITRIMAPGGLFIVRLYVASNPPQSAATIYQQFSRGQIRDSHELKFRLWFALERAGGKGVCLNDVWNSFEAACSDLRSRNALPDWPEAEWLSMQAYEGLQDVYYFPSVEQLTGLMNQNHRSATLEANITPSGTCNEHLRILSFRLKR